MQYSPFPSVFVYLVQVKKTAKFSALRLSCHKQKLHEIQNAYNAHVTHHICAQQQQQHHQKQHQQQQHNHQQQQCSSFLHNKVIFLNFIRSPFPSHSIFSEAIFASHVLFRTFLMYVCIMSVINYYVGKKSKMFSSFSYL